MTCESCINRVADKLKSVPGVAAANVSLRTQQADVSLVLVAVLMLTL